MKENIFTSNENIGMGFDRSKTYSDVSGLSLQKLFFAETGNFPSCYFFTQEGRSQKIFDVPGFTKYVLENTPEEEELEMIQYITENLDTTKTYYGCSFAMRKSQLYLRIETNIGDSYVLFNNGRKEDLEKLLEVVKKFYIEPEEEDLGNYFTLSQTSTGYRLLEQRVKTVKDFDIKLQYNDDFTDIDDMVKDFLEKKGKSGIVFLHGEKGTGKSTYIAHLISEYPDLRFVSIPPSLVGCLTQPQFTDFMHNNLHNTVIILEDCESAIKSRETSGSDGGVETLLNLSDGLPSDDLGIKFICTFNYTNLIDSALTRKGRLAVKYEFKNLVAEKVRELLPIVIQDKIDEYESDIAVTQDEIIATEDEKTIKKLEDRIERFKRKIEKLNEIPEYTSNKGMSLADIYNIDQESFENEKKKITF